MYFELDEVDGYESAKALLIDRCEAWAGDLPIRCDPFVVSAALDFRHAGTDGRLGFWTAGLVREFLLDWAPRKISATADDLAHAPQSLDVLIRYLRYSDLDDPGGDSVPVLQDAIADATAGFRSAMTDERNFGLAKFWMMKALAAGVDLTDTAEMEEFSRSARSGEVDYDPAVLEHIMARRAGATPDERAPSLAPVLLASPANLREDAGRSKVVLQLRELAQWIGAGRSLTPKGHLKLADARELVELLSTGDVIDPVIGERTFRTQSSAELTGVTVMVEWAKKMRLVRVVKNRLVVVAKSKPLLSDELALWNAAFDAVGELGRVLLPGGYLGPTMLADLFDEVLPDLLTTIYALPTAFPVVRLGEAVWAICAEMFAVDDVSEMIRSTWQRGNERDLRRILQLLADLGAVELTTGRADPMYLSDLKASGPDELDGLGPFGLSPEAAQRIRTAFDGETQLVVLTALGTAAMRSRLVAQGRFAPQVGDLASASVGQLLGVISEHYTAETGRAEIVCWLDAHPSEGLEGLLDAVRSCAFRTRAVALLDVLADAQPDRNGLLNRLRADPALAPTAIQLLVSDGQLTMEDLGPSEGLLGMAEHLLQLLELGGPEDAREVLAEIPDLAELAYALEHSGHPDHEGIHRLRRLVIEPLLHHGQRPRRLHAVSGSKPAKRKKKPKRHRHR